MMDNEDFSSPESLCSLEAWDYSLEVQCLADESLKDLQLAAELGKTLLERNKELETSLKQYQGVIEDQAQEIEYLTKQTAALREVNDSRLRIYEQLEVSIQDLERTNQKLAADNTNDKRHIKSLCAQIEALDAKCEELQRTLDEVTAQRKRQEQLLQQNEKPIETLASGCTAVKPTDVANSTSPTSKHSPGGETKTKDASTEEVVQLLSQLQDLRTAKVKEQVRAKELEEQLAVVLQENVHLQEQLETLQMKEKDLKSIQEEISTLEEVRQGQLCRRCLRLTDTRGQDELSLVMDNEEDDVTSVSNSVTSETYCSTVMLHIEDDNPYKELEARYAALLEMQRQPRRHAPPSPPSNQLSLQEELQMSGDFNSFHHIKDTESDQEALPEVPQQNGNQVSGEKQQPNRRRAGKTSSATPTDFSEAETSSSGFSDETSNKSTQTELSGLPAGSYLCSIADGEDCRFSIYDDASPVESRFRKTPEYRQLFREIFAVLKRAAEEKGEGEQLPRLDDATPTREALPKVPPATPAKEEAPLEFATKEECKKETKTMPRQRQPNSKRMESQPSEPEKASSSENPGTSAESSNSGLVLRPLPPKSEQIEYLSVGIAVKKKGKRKNSPMKRMNVAVETSPVGTSGLNYSGRASNSGRNRQQQQQTRTWYRSDSPRHHSNNSSRYAAYDKSWEPQQQFPSPAYEGVVKLKQLDMSYAEALRNGPRKTSPGNVNGYRK
ncbi:cerebellar degeneration-related protein 2 isoform X1 [Schistocerca piceifrons]|uniref:cerebellar degeneration-related protein 2 isoform X1 n=1 Tax=Schistocerca piceifrons TaxID=274613 RepID=UPI001F5F4CA5|nr:cerebellar degeneration-related protein 2 isoform X1 [Schistocerca piceifrons]